MHNFGVNFGCPQFDKVEKRGQALGANVGADQPVIISMNSTTNQIKLMTCEALNVQIFQMTCYVPKRKQNFLNLGLNLNFSY